ncbi:MAG: hypothetical protein JSS51_07695 [Planctomycetes bacterium]|nr:hypothetical protein [Planctomycetota bacterium]
MAQARSARISDAGPEYSLKPDNWITFFSRPEGRPVSADLVIATTLAHLKIDLLDISGPGRHYRAVLARGIIVCLLRELTTLSFPDIARRIGKTNHSSTITSRKLMQDRLAARSIVGDANDRIDVRETYIDIGELVLAHHHAEQHERMSA